jgi:hypothetical protein
MFKNFNLKAAYLLAFAAITALSFSVLNGCDDAGNVSIDPTDTNVSHFDSIVVEELETAGSLNGINLLNGVSTNGSYNLRDASLAGGSDSTGSNFYLRSGVFFDQLLDAGYESKWFQVMSNSTQTDFDTLTAIRNNIGTELDTADFTQTSTEFWGYFNYPLAEYPIYCFWLNGKKNGGLTNGKNVYGIIRPKVSFDSNPGGVFGFRIAFEVKINKNGDNYFYHSH